MGKMSKFNLIVFILLISFIAASAVRIVVRDETEARDIFLGVSAITAECKVIKIEKVMDSAQRINTAQTLAFFSLDVNVAGKVFSEPFSLPVRGNDELEIKTIVQRVCDARLVELREKPTVVIQYDNPVLRQVYDVIGRVWRHKVT